MTADKRPALSIVIPMLDEAPVLAQLLDRIEEVFSDTPGGWEVVAVDDGSRDETWRILKSERAKRPWLHGIRLAAPHGQHKATLIGLKSAEGSIIVIMDADLQVQPEDMKRLVEKVIEDVDLAFAVRDHTDEGFLRREVGTAVNRFLSSHSKSPADRPLSTFLAVRRELVERALAIRVARPVVPSHLMLAGPRKVVWMMARNDVRSAGRSKYGLLRLISVTADIMFGYTTLPEAALLAGVVAAPVIAGLAWMASLAAALLGWGVVSAAAFLSGAAWALLCVVGMLFVTGQLALRASEQATSQAYSVRETF